MDYTINEILGTKQNVYDGKDSVRFKVDGVEHILSTLTTEASKYSVGATIHGTITSKEKDGKTFYNFNEKKSNVVHGTAPSANTEAMLKKILDYTYATHIAVQSIVQNMKPGVKYPESQGEVNFTANEVAPKPTEDYDFGKDVPF